MYPVVECIVHGCIVLCVGPVESPVPPPVVFYERRLSDST